MFSLCILKNTVCCLNKVQFNITLYIYTSWAILGSTYYCLVLLCIIFILLMFYLQQISKSLFSALNNHFHSPMLLLFLSYLISSWTLVSVWDHFPFVSRIHITILFQWGSAVKIFTCIFMACKCLYFILGEYFDGYKVLERIFFQNPEDIIILLPLLFPLRNQS